MQHPSVEPLHENKIRALAALSDLPATIDFAELVTKLKGAPDPETAVQTVLNEMAVPSDVLKRKWRSTLMELWSVQHPNVPMLPGLALSSDEVAAVPMLADALGVMRALASQSALLTEEHTELLLTSSDVWRLAGAMPSLTGTQPLAVESEWAYPTLRRLRAVLQALRLVRAVKGQLVVVRSRWERFEAFPATQQFYVLWHADTYHVDWSEFAGMWGKYVRVIQDYLPLLWEIGVGITSGRQVDRREWCGEILDTFVPLWEEEGLLDVGTGRAAVLTVVQQHALPTILDKFLVRDMLQRHGLATLKEEFGSLTKFTWSKVGAAVFAAELAHELPCGRELLAGSTSTSDHGPQPAFSLKL